MPEGKVTFPLPSRERVAPKAPGEGRARINKLILAGTLTLPTPSAWVPPSPGAGEGLNGEAS
ncbi:hypothetical protein GCM10022293_12120 [Azospirillum formosense]